MATIQKQKLYQLNNYDIFKDYFSNTSFIPANAFIYGLIINDFDYTLRSRVINFKETDLQIPFQYIENIPDLTKSAQYTSVDDILGRFEPIIMYTGNDAITFSLTLIYIAEQRYNQTTTNNGQPKTYWTLENIEKIQKKIESLVYPYYTNGYAAPSRVRLNILNIINNLSVVVKSVKIEYQEPFDIQTSLSLYRKITLDLQVAYPLWQNISAEQIFMQEAGNKVYAYKELKSTWTTIKNRRKGTLDTRMAQYVNRNRG